MEAMSIQIIIILCIGVLAVVMVATRIAGGRYGHLRPSQEATESYTSFRVDPEKHYYISGPEAHPNALMGLNKNRTLESDLWKRKDLDDAGMKELVVNMQHKAMEQMFFLQGFDIHDDQGLKIGDWYSIMGLHITIQMMGENRVSITTPPLTTYPEH